MEITDVRVGKLSEEGKMRGIVSVTFDNAFVVHDIKIIEGQSGLFIAMPSRKVGEGEFRDIAHPINSEMRKSLQDDILRAYEEAKVRMEVEEDEDYVEQE
ncbi:putative septation protein spoVG (Stage V sporulation protein G) [Acetoanaerobium sticklandii]|uniref:Putative septation protein SpoVG n=1 Tax=Acetoanaerobium sticklandii (strain ATCC 12662 / DSM 519 / JCM 1433 / CCUG 9281 / NCIMB 10654 / HF) TaxID=499177 RepID=E3PVN4_ACESD|nr:septation regulator SpoVG [Acetoanaerobium sticklandii]CBH20601.1 putative septation protein spoVG (Stage V sporulation protein G) [Acetoanaerobium sticklandii]